MSLSFIPHQAEKADKIATSLTKTTMFLLVGLIFLLPLVWLQPAFLLLSSAKVFLAVFIVLTTLVIGSLALLRSSSVHIQFYSPLIAWWALVATSALAALFAPDYLQALVGFSMGIHTVAFLSVLGVLMSIMFVFSGSKQWSLIAVVALVAPVLILSLIHLIRVLFGAEALTFGVNFLPTDTLAGTWNDLGILLLVAILVMLVTLIQLPLPNTAQAALLIGIVLCLAILSLVNFSILWFALGFFSLALLLYVLTRDRFSSVHSAPSLYSVVALSLATVVSIIFIIGGSNIGGYISNATGTSFIEVRPSFGATVDLTRQTLNENLLFGVGPNHYNEAWRNYRDDSINQTIFWNIEFDAGNSYITTWFATTGMAGIIAWLVFILLFFYSGIRILITGTGTDRFWYFVATVSFLVASIVWLVSLVYVPGPVILLYGAVASGLLFASAKSLNVKPLCNLSLVANARTGLLFIGFTMIVITSSVGVGYVAANQLSALRTYASINNVAEGENQIEEVASRIFNAYQIFPRDVYLREIVSLRLQQAQSLMLIEDPDEQTQQQFQAIIGSASEVANNLVQIYPRNPINWSTLGSVFQVLAMVGVEGASERAVEAYSEAANRDPKNPLYHAQIAAVLVRAGDNEGAREAVRKSLQLKTNFFDAISILTQLEIATGNVEEAIQNTISLISLEPRTAGLYYQLGVLYLSNEDLSSAISTLGDSLTLDPNFANARYVRALALAQSGDRQRAIDELEIVRGQNEENRVVEEIIALIRDDSQDINALELLIPVQEPVPTIQQDVVLSDGADDTNVLTPLNPVPNTRNQSNENQNNEATANETEAEDNNETSSPEVETEVDSEE